MPTTSKAQTRLMQGVKNNPTFARKVGIKQSVGEDFIAANKAQGVNVKKLPNRKGK